MGTLNLSLIIIVFSFVLTGSDILAQTYVDYYNQGVTHYKNQNYSEFLLSFRKADSLRPNHPVIMYNLAIAYSKVNNFEQVANTLEKRFIFNASSEFLEDEDFAEFRKTEYFEKVNNTFLRNTEVKSTSELMFSIEELGFHPEGIAYHKETKRFLFTDVHNGTVVSYDLNGKDRTLVSDIAIQGFWGAFGIKVDPKNAGIIWVTTALLPEFKGFKEVSEGESALLKIDLNSGKILEVYKAETDIDHIFGELVISKEGVIYVSDSATPHIYKLDPDGEQLSLFFESDILWNLQGLDLSRSEKFLYFSDYILGVYKMDLDSKTITPVLGKNNFITRGTDGLYHSGRKLILLQNGTSPRRVSIIDLKDSDNEVAQKIDILDQNRSSISEPTMGVFVDDEFYFIGNSPWAFYTKENKPDSETWPVINIFKL